MRTLLLAPHNDDETLFASFLCLRYEPLVVVCYQSELQRIESGISALERESETDAALEILCPRAEAWQQWRDPDVDDYPMNLRTGLQRLREQREFDVVFAPAIERLGHPQHSIVGHEAKEIFNGIPVRHYLTYTNPPLRRSTSQREIEYEPEWIALKHQALACYRSQARTPSRRHFMEGLAEYWA